MKKDNALKIGLVGIMWLAAVLACSVPDQPKVNSSSATASWHPVIEFTGKSDKETESFNIQGDEWRVSWDHKGERNFMIFVLGKGSASATTANTIGPDRDSSIKYGSGYYHLKIITSGQYTIRIEDKY